MKKHAPKPAKKVYDLAPVNFNVLDKNILDKNGDRIVGAIKNSTGTWVKVEQPNRRVVVKLLGDAISATNPDWEKVFKIASKNGAPILDQLRPQGRYSDLAEKPNTKKI